MGRRGRDIPWLEQRDNGVYYVHWYDKGSGRTKRQSLNTRDSDEAARGYGEFLVGGPRSGSGPTTGLTVAQALGDYGREHVDAEDDQGRPLVADQTRQRLAMRHLLAYFGDAPIAKIGPLESRAYVAARRAGRIGGGARRKDKRGADSTIRRELSCLAAAFHHAVKWERLDAACRIELPAVARSNKVKWLTKAQLGHAIDTAEGGLRDFILLAYYTAARRKSIEHMRVSQVDLRRGVIDLMPEGARTTRKRKPVVPIYSDIRPVVERMMSETTTPWLFGTPRSFYRDFVAHMADIGVSAHPHMLRHSRATHMLMDGEELWKVAKLLGDTVQTVESTYGHTSPEFLQTESRIGGER